MGEEIAFKNGRISDFQGLVTLTLTLNQVIRHTVMHHSSTSTYTPNFIKIEVWTNGQTYGRTFETHFIRLTRSSRPKMLALATVTRRILATFFVPRDIDLFDL